jgi:hypothetical protein
MGMFQLKTIRFLLCLVWFIPVGCVLDDGQGFTVAKLTAEVQWDSNRRIGEDGRFTTSKSYEIEFEAFDLSVRAIALTTASQVSSDVFDPANPPAGYSLCHNGHCHADSGELVDYDEIILSLGGSNAGKEVAQLVDAPVSLDLRQVSDTQSLSLGICTDVGAMCEVGPDSVNAATMYISSASVKLRVFQEGTLPEGGVAFDLNVPVASGIQKPLTIALDTEGPEEITLNLSLIVNESIWDHIEFSDLIEQSPEVQILAFSQAMDHGLSLEIN